LSIKVLYFSSRMEKGIGFLVTKEKFQF